MVELAGDFGRLPLDGRAPDAIRHRVDFGEARAIAVAVYGDAPRLERASVGRYAVCYP